MGKMARKCMKVKDSLIRQEVNATANVSRLLKNQS